MSVQPFKRKPAASVDGRLPKLEFPRTRKRRARRHLGDVSDEDWETLMDALVEWLARVNVPGSIAWEYNLYRALDDERALAQHRRSRKGGA